MLQLKRLVVFLDALKKCVGEWKDARAKEKEKTEVMTVVQLTERMGKKVAGINLLEIESYLKRSKVCHPL
jgi:chromosome transmission fidelity protein 1